jgi:hypothetical protein
MRKLFLGFSFILLTNIVNAQLPKHAIGLRLGGGEGFGTELSYQHGLNDKNRLEFDLGMRSNKLYNAWGVTGLYHWVWNIQPGFNWYAGAGARIGSWTWDSVNYLGTENGGLFLSGAGNIGIEYTLPIKIQFALDARPEFGLIAIGDSFRTNVSISVRYQF